MCAISVGIMFADHRQNHLDSIRKTLSLVVYPIQYVVSLPASLSGWASENLDSREVLLEENAKLKHDQIKYRAQLQKLAALKAENHRLRELLQSSRKVGEHVLIGELLAVDLDPFSRQIVINKGSSDSVYQNQPVLDAHGIMGQVVYVSPFSSTAMLITDANHAIPVQVNRNNLRAIVEGNGSSDTMDINYLPNSADIQEGDLLTSSGLGGIYPPDYPVARVKSVLRNPAKPYAKIVVEPVALLEKSREVLLVWHSDRKPDTGFIDESLPFEQTLEHEAVGTPSPSASQNVTAPITPNSVSAKPKPAATATPKPKPKPATPAAPKPKPKPAAPAAPEPKPKPVAEPVPKPESKPGPKPELEATPQKPAPETAPATPSGTDSPPATTDTTKQGGNNNDAQ